MRNGLVIASALLAASCNAAADQSSEQAQETKGASSEAAAGGTGDGQSTETSPTASANFAFAAAASDLFEIATGRLAMEKGQSAETREFAKKMVDDHTASLRALNVLVSKSEAPVVLPTRVDAMQQGFIDKLSRADAKDFDREYMNRQIDEHETALKLHQDFQASPQDSELMAYSQKVLPVIRAHYDHLARAGAAKDRVKSGSVEQ